MLCIMYPKNTYTLLYMVIREWPMRLCPNTHKILTDYKNFNKKYHAYSFEKVYRQFASRSVRRLEKINRQPGIQTRVGGLGDRSLEGKG